MSDDSLKIKVSSQDRSDRSTRGRRGPNKYIVGTSVAVGLAIFIALLISLRSGDEPEEATVQAPRQENAVVERKLPTPEVEDSLSEIAGSKSSLEDDGKTLWVSPTSGTSLNLAYVPPGTRLLLHVRPAALLAHPEGEKVVAALGPWGEWALAQIEKYSGAKLPEISSLLIAVHTQESGALGYTLRLQMLEPWTDKKLAQRLPDSNAVLIAEQACRVVEGRACFLPEAEAGRTLLVCQQEAIAEIVSNGASPPPFPRDLQRIVARTDADRMVTLLFPAKYFQASGNELLQGTAKQLISAFQKVVGNDTTTVALSMHWDENFFGELLSTIVLNRKSNQFLAAIAERLSQSPGELGATITDASFPTYGREVLIRFPAMLEQLSKYTRVGNEQGIGVVRCYLPSSAGHNILAAAELMLNCFQEFEQPEGGLVGSDSPTQPRPQSVAEALEQPTTLSFPKETLQMALEILSEDLGVAIELRGSDLQLEGITKNQSFAVDLREQTGAEVLLAILKLANPDRTATGPADPKQKLVYVVREAENGENGVIVVTTRVAAASRGDLLPDVFGATVQ